MTTKLYFSLPYRVLLLMVLLLATGCAPRNVELLGLTGPEQLETDQAGTFEATINEEAKPPVTYAWDFGDDQSAQGAVASHSFAEAGTYTVTVSVSNRRGRGTDSDTTSVVVVNPPVPAEIVTLLANLYEVDNMTAVRFDANVRGDAPLTYAWDFGDGSSSSEPAPSHTFSEPGSYTVTLTLSNDHGQDSRNVSITSTQYEADYCADLAEMNSVFFERNTSVLSESSETVLRDNIQILQDCPNLSVRIEGLAGPFERRPQELSEDRARAVEQFYLSNDVAASRITAAGLGRVGQGSKKSGAEQFRRTDTIPMQ